MGSPYHGVRALRVRQAHLINRIKNKYPKLSAEIDQVRFDWYTIRNAADVGGSPNTTEVFIYDEIGGPCSDLQADEFVKELNNITTPNIVCRINSPGGSLFDGIAIYNALVQHPANVTCRVDAIAASAASIIAMAGTTEMMIGSQLMIHDAMGMEMGNAREMREMADFLEMQSNNIAHVYSAKASPRLSPEARQIDVQNWREKMLAETWMFADEAVTSGLANQIYVRPETVEPSATVPEETDSPAEVDELAVAEADVVENLMRFDHITAGNTRKYKHTSRAHAASPLNADTKESTKSFFDLYGKVA